MTRKNSSESTLKDIKNESLNSKQEATKTDSKMKTNSTSTTPSSNGSGGDIAPTETATQNVNMRDNAKTANTPNLQSKDSNVAPIAVKTMSQTNEELSERLASIERVLQTLIQEKTDTPANSPTASTGGINDILSLIGAAKGLSGEGGGGDLNTQIIGSYVAQALNFQNMILQRFMEREMGLKSARNAPISKVTVT